MRTLQSAKPDSQAPAVRKRRSQVERSATTRTQLIEAAVSCIAQYGLNQSTLVFIANKAGVTSGALQHHFRSRNELLLMVVEEFGKSLADSDEDRHGKEHTKDESVKSRVSRIFDRYWAVFSSPQFLAVMKIWLGTQINTAVYREMLDKMRWFEIRFDREWIELFSDCPAAPETISTARHVALGAMRGLALGLSYSVERHRGRMEVSLLENMLVRTLEGLSPKSEPTVRTYS